MPLLSVFNVTTIDHCFTVFECCSFINEYTQALYRNSSGCIIFHYCLTPQFTVWSLSLCRYLPTEDMLHMSMRVALICNHECCSKSLYGARRLSCSCCKRGMLQPLEKMDDPAGNLQLCLNFAQLPLHRKDPEQELFKVIRGSGKSC